MSRRAATITQADVARAIRAAKTGRRRCRGSAAGRHDYHTAKAPPLVPSDEDSFEKWERENESAKAARRRDRV
jgi:hypothetical protein